MIDLTIANGVVTNNLYMSFDQDNSEYYSYGAKVDTTAPKDGFNYMRDEASFSVRKADFMQARKYIRLVEKEGNNYKPVNQWSPTGVSTDPGGYFQYLLRLDNNTRYVKNHTEIIDVCPMQETILFRLIKKVNGFLDSLIFSNTLLKAEF